jgi:hypothetical protein
MPSSELIKVILDYDGTLTAEEEQVGELAEKSLATLSREILKVPLSQLRADYVRTRARILAAPHKYWWEVNGGIAAYSDEGAFITNTTTLQTMLRQNHSYTEALARHFPRVEYDPVADCCNYLFHKHTFELPPRFRPAVQAVLGALVEQTNLEPVILSSSKGDKITKNLKTIGFEETRVLGDTRQYGIDPSWRRQFAQPDQGTGQIFRVDELHTIDLRRPAYYKKLTREMESARRLLVVADTWSMPGAMPMMMDIPFLLLKTAYTPAWCEAYVSNHPYGAVLASLTQLPETVRSLT